MHHRILLFLVLLLQLPLFGAVTKVPLMVNEATGVISGPSNLFLANTNLMLNAISTYTVSQRSCWVNASGNDATGALNTREKPFKTIQAALTNVSWGNCIIYVQYEIYKVGNHQLTNWNDASQAGITIANKTNLAIVGMGWPWIQPTNNAGDVISIENCSNVVIQGMCIGWTNTPASTTLSASTGGKSWGLVSIRSNNFGIYLLGNKGFNSRCHGFGTWHETGGSGRPATMTTMFVAKGNELWNIGTFTDPGYTSTSPLGFGGEGDCIELMNMQDSTISGNHCHDFEQNGIRLFEYGPGIGGSQGNCNRISIVGNKLERGKRDGIQGFGFWPEQKLSAITVKNNRIFDFDNTDVTKGFVSGVFLAPVSEADVSGNLIFNMKSNGTITNTSGGITISGGSRNCTVRENKVYRCGYGISMGSRGLATDGPQYANTISGNQVFSNGIDGITIAGVANIVRDNTVYDNNAGSTSSQRFLGSGILLQNTTASNIFAGSGTIASGSNVVTGNFIFATPGSGTNSGQVYGLNVQSDNNIIGDNYFVNTILKNTSIASVAHTVHFGFDGLTPSYVNTADSSAISTTGSDQTFSVSIPLRSRAFTKGKRYIMTARGRYTSTASPGTVQFKLKETGGTVLDFGALTIPASITAGAWRLDASFTVRAENAAYCNATGQLLIDAGTAANPTQRLLPGNNTLTLNGDSDTTLSVTINLDTSGQSFVLEEISFLN